MSGSRSVAAAQRRRGPESTPSRGSNISINSSQAFTQQHIQPGTSGRLAGQHAALQQQQQQQQKQQAKPVPTNKMTIPQAITLITLRLGRVENQLQNLDVPPTGEFNENGDFVSNVEESVLNTILERLDMLEKSFMDLPSIKQQMDLLKPALIKSSTTTSGLNKDVKEIKSTIEQIKSDVLLTQNLVKDLEILVNYVDVDENTQTDETEICVENNDELSTNINLKEIIEQELNA